jgi:hypothetical protein
MSPHYMLTKDAASASERDIRGVEYDKTRRKDERTPIVIEDSIQALTNGTDGIDSFPYRVQQYLRLSTDGGNLTTSTYDDSGGYPSPDAFLNHVIL